MFVGTIVMTQNIAMLYIVWYQISSQFQIWSPNYKIISIICYNDVNTSSNQKMFNRP